MSLFYFFRKSIERQWGRFLLFLIGITIAVAGTLSPWMISRSMETALADAFDLVGANMIIAPPPGQYDMPLDVVESIFSIHESKNIAVVSPKVLGILDAPEGHLTIMGIAFDEEIRLKRWWSVEGEWPSSFRGDVPPHRYNHMSAKNLEEERAKWQVPEEQVLGEQVTGQQLQSLVLGRSLAEDRGWAIGEQVEIAGYHFRVQAILDPLGTEEDNMALIDIALAAHLLERPEQLSMIEIAALCATCPIEVIVSQIEEVLPGYQVEAVREAAEMRQMIIGRFTVFSALTGFVVAMAGIMLVGLTAAAQARERQWEIALLQAIGFGRKTVTLLLSAQIGLAGLLAGLLGYSTALGLSLVLWPYLAPGVMSPVTFFYPLEGLLTVLAASLVGMAAGYPIFSQTAKKDPARLLGSQ
ncbi:FtsX-like permease family protein [Heliorestis acidaminivorans]|uniref:FtsX-like permease family protein n=1 Tax=Heliorestis acidaminivorans TaxID=553427 RepID=A0A6I0F278_9FIRM|nr:FtsX-like permease family protein [Heliorestis acidaminivorans]KAB2953660.1 FtsX-like permease family protein [Heliorestis acidaminivorans]